MQKVWGFLRREKVLTISLAAALLSMLFVPPDAAYAGYIDWDVLMLLFSLMAVVAGVKSSPLFARATRALLRAAGTTRRLVLLLSLACFFCSMLITNDVALLTFVPVTVSLLSGQPGALIYAVALESVSANLGSMATPIGNPQNLYLFSHYHMEMSTFLRALLPLTAASLVLILLACLLLPRRSAALEAAVADEVAPSATTAYRWKLPLYGAQFLLCVLAVLRVIPKHACFAFTLVTLLAWDRKSLARVDYALLGTFACFFVFVGNLGRIEAVRALMTGVTAGHDLEVGILASQVLSNVPAALMLSGFTQNATSLMQGVDIGGLGTLIASLASLIAYKQYMKAPGAKAGSYLKVFTLMNLAFLAALYALAKLLT